jgi:hypothetical protein
MELSFNQTMGSALLGVFQTMGSVSGGVYQAVGSVRTVWGSTVSDRRNTRARHSRCLHAVFESDRRNTSYRPSLLVLSYSSLL